MPQRTRHRLLVRPVASGRGPPNRLAQLGVAEALPPAEGQGHFARCRQGVIPLQLAAPGSVVAIPFRLELPGRAFHDRAGDAAAAVRRGIRSVPDDLSPQLREVRVAATVLHDAFQGVRLDSAAFGGEWPLDSLRRGLRAETADREDFRPVPKGHADARQLILEVRRSRENEEERGIPAGRLGGVQQDAGDFGADRVGLINQHHERPLVRPRLQDFRQRRLGNRVPEPRTDALDEGVPQCAPLRLGSRLGSRLHSRFQLSRRRDVGGRQPNPVQRPARPGLLPRPRQQGGLPVARRPVERDETAGSGLLAQALEPAAEDRLLRRPSRQAGRRPSGHGPKRISHGHLPFSGGV